MAKIPATEIFNDIELKSFTQCAKYFPDILEKLDVKAEIVCHVEDEKEILLYMVMAKGKNAKTECFFSLTLEEFQSKLILLNDVVLLANENNTNIDEAINSLLSQGSKKYLAILSDIKSITNLFDCGTGEDDNKQDQTMDMLLESFIPQKITLH